MAVLVPSAISKQCGGGGRLLPVHEYRQLTTDRWQLKKTVSSISLVATVSFYPATLYVEDSSGRLMNVAGPGKSCPLLSQKTALRQERKPHE
jgi:hypothetical protein